MYMLLMGDNELGVDEDLNCHSVKGIFGMMV